MGLFGALVRTVVNVAMLPVDAAKDVCTLGGTLTDEPSAVKERIEQIKDEADEDFIEGD